jgi:DNA-binding XRE family transcriptional regulator
VKTRIKELRARYGLTQAALAQLVNVRRETIIHLEKGRYTPSIKLGFLLACALKTSIDDLFIFEISDFSGSEIPHIHNFLQKQELDMNFPKS